MYWSYWPHREQAHSYNEMRSPVGAGLPAKRPELPSNFWRIATFTCTCVKPFSRIARFWCCTASGNRRKRQRCWMA